MPASVRFLADLRVVEAVFAGDVTKEALLNTAKAALERARSEQTSHFLSNCQEMTGGHSAIDVFGILSILPPAALSTAWKNAVLLPLEVDTASAKNVAFWEDACVSRAVNVRSFQDRADALSWLAED